MDFQNLNTLKLLTTVVRVGCALLAFLTATQSAVAQSDSENAEQQSPAVVKNGFMDKDGFLNGEARLYVDQDGLPVIYPITIDELREMDRETAEAARLPYTVNSVVLRGTVSPEAVDCSIEVGVQLGDKDGRANVDVKLRTVQLDKYPTFSSEAEKNRFRVAPEGSGYQWLLLGEPNSKHQLSIQGTSVVQNRDGLKAIIFDIPSAAFSEITIKLPRNATNVDASDGELTSQLAADSVVANIKGARGSFELTWREASDTPEAAAVEASSTTTFQIGDPEQPWSASTQLEVKWFGSVADGNFTVSLPAGARWSALPPTIFDRYEIKADPIKGENSLQVVNLSPLESDTINLLLEWEWQPTDEPVEELSARVQLDNLQLDGVDSHSGTINCIYPSAYSSIYEQGEGIKLIQQGPSEGLTRQQQQFRFTQQNFDLQLTFRREQSLPTVRPIYHIAIDESKLRMTAWFECSFDTTRQRTDFGLVTGDWVIEENNAVLMKGRRPDSDDQETLEVQRRPDGTYILRSNELDPSGAARRVRQLWKVVAERTWSPDDGNIIEFQIPKIIRGVVGQVSETDHGSGVLLVTAAENVLLDWEPTASVSLIPDAFSTEYKPFVPEQRLRSPQAYRFQSGVTTPKWAGKTTFLPQQISFEQRCNVEIQSTQLLVRQDYDLRIANRPLERLQIATRKDADPKPQVFVNGNLISIQPVSKLDANALRLRLGLPNEQSATQEWNEYDIVGMPALIGPARLSIITTVPWNISNNGQDVISTVTNIPLSQLLLPPDSHSIQRQWSASSNLALDKLRLLKSNAATSKEAESSSGRLVELGIPIELPSGTLDLRLEIQTRLANTRIQTSCELSWLQTVMSGQERHERFVARVNSNAKQLLYRLPALAQLNRVAIDGVQLDQSSAPYDYSTNRVTIRLPVLEQTRGSTQLPTYVVEIFYSLPESLGWVTPVSVRPPELSEGSQSGNFTWQLVTPTTQHLTANPPGLTPEWTWQWGGAWWYRISENDQTSLENLLGSSTQARLPAAANSYVMSGPTNTAEMQVMVLARFMLWLPIGSLAILGTLAALSYSRLRNPVTVMLLGGILLSLATIWPDLAMLLAQTSVIACVLIALVLATQIAVDARLRRRSVFATRPSVFSDGSDQYSVERLTPASGTRTGNNQERSGSRAELVRQTASSVSSPQEEL